MGSEESQTKFCSAPRTSKPIAPGGSDGPALASTFPVRGAFPLARCCAAELCSRSRAGSLLGSAAPSFYAVSSVSGRPASLV